MLPSRARFRFTGHRHSSSIPIQRGNQMRCSTPCRDAVQVAPPRARRERECHLYFARRVTFLSCADMAAPLRVRAFGGERRDEKGCRNCPSGRGHGPIRRASGPSPSLACLVWRAEAATTWRFRIEPRQIALIGTTRGVGHVLPDPIRAHRRAFIQNAPLRPVRGLPMGVSFFAGPPSRPLVHPAPP